MLHNKTAAVAKNERNKHPLRTNYENDILSCS